MKAKRWYIFFPGDAYALGPIDLDAPGTEKDARDWAREWGGYKRLPAGFQCWAA